MFLRQLDQFKEVIEHKDYDYAEAQAKWSILLVCFEITAETATDKERQQFYTLTHAYAKLLASKELIDRMYDRVTKESAIANIALPPAFHNEAGVIYNKLHHYKQTETLKNTSTQTVDRQDTLLSSLRHYRKAYFQLQSEEKSDGDILEVEKHLALLEVQYPYYLLQEMIENALHYVTSSSEVMQKFNDWKEYLEIFSQELLAQGCYSEAKNIYRSWLIPTGKKIKLSRTLLEEIIENEADIVSLEIASTKNLSINNFNMPSHCRIWSEDLKNYKKTFRIEAEKFCQNNINKDGIANKDDF
jgi:hypothetical protein